ncbi:hypothetical protein ACFUGD_27080 [Streptomyces sp. NPDC057217]|uniref:hypothetical protein n=1 Tax=Streptomyces sp. NPDC057217 TaxID=3346054 RepID=UPI00363F1D10
MPERRIGTALAAAGVLLTLIGTLLYVLPGPGLPVVATGLAVLAAGTVLVVVTRRSRPGRQRRAPGDRPPEAGGTWDRSGPA